MLGAPAASAAACGETWASVAAAAAPQSVAVHKTLLILRLPKRAQRAPASEASLASVSSACSEPDGTAADGAWARPPASPTAAAAAEEAGDEEQEQPGPPPDECIFCFEEQPLCELRPCGHRLMCTGCSRRYVGPSRRGQEQPGEEPLPPCPICREQVRWGVSCHCSCNQSLQRMKGLACLLACRW